MDGSHGKLIESNQETWTVDGTVLQRESHEPCQIVEFLNRNDRIQN
ncbi:hypothetical protein [Allorhodopirellula heiligendammensis]|nr:hypothetical protein [Allorhodopirellula heiligendammensis]